MEVRGMNVAVARAPGVLDRLPARPLTCQNASSRKASVVMAYAAAGMGSRACECESGQRAGADGLGLGWLETAHYCLGASLRGR